MQTWRIEKRSTRGSNIWKSCVLAILVIVLWFGNLAQSSAASNRQEDNIQLVHAAYNVVMFISWPDYLFNGPDAPFIFCSMIGPSFGEILKQYVSGRYVGDRKAVHMHLEDIEDTGRCQVLLVSSDNKKLVGDVLEVRNSGVLTISTTESFARSGGMIGIVNEQDRSKLYVNHQALREAHLGVSSNLLNITIIVDK